MENFLHQHIPIGQGVKASKQNGCEALEQTAQKTAGNSSPGSVHSLEQPGLVGASTHTRELELDAL